MTRLFNAPADFPEELLEGFVAAYPRHVRAVRGGVVRAGRHDEVAVIAGGGSGHYPAFCGLVGAGLAHGAVVGNLFSSPSAQQAHSVGRAADAGRGVIFSFGNYAGDVMHFGRAAEQLSAEGVRAECVIVTDDIASASVDEMDKRRGVAGDLVVFKVMGAAAAEGWDLDDVVRVGRHANDRTRSLGVAFSGCTMPGAREPLFAVPEGMMSVGLGIHGEPGIYDIEIPTADGLAELFVSSLLSERPAGHDGRVAVVLNGLGTVKYEELFVVFRRVHRLLSDAGLTVVDPDVGELCTSLDMGGASLTLVWLDDELERLWTAGANAPAYRKGNLPQDAAGPAVGEAPGEIERGPAVPLATAQSQELAARVHSLLGVLAETLVEAADELGRLDAIAGDGDHGIGMERGSRAALAAATTALHAGAGAGTLLQSAGEAWSDKAGGTSGMLWGVALGALGETIGDRHGPDAQRVADGVADARAQIMAVGKAELGDKTLVDALVPFSETLSAHIAERMPLVDAWAAAAASATAAAEATAALSPRRGRARPLAHKSIGTPDPGAVSLALITRRIGAALAVASDTPAEQN
ncbi:dihydroxyacetone kinase family protein [Microterricola viridarii]|uniref:Homodimeric dihydroxyacetone kinase n=1 Tax=Microterricola viridarii TaxID=412690 RepID=A0A1H1QE80_9MICO|nr:dihydroxyacetone kinase family protein [Microterricola viridarii]SDS21623.1 homodimeric dihydroxyacetone kinase [Microterricola viridarii]